MITLISKFSAKSKEEVIALIYFDSVEMGPNFLSSFRYITVQKRNR